MTNKLLSTFILMIVTGCLSQIFAQKQIIGIVKSEEGELLKSVQVQIEHTTLVTLTNEQGYFQFSNLKGEKAILTFTHAAYNIMKKEVDLPSKELQVILIPKATQLEEVLIRSYVNKNTETSNKMPLNFLENPQVFSSLDKSVLENQVLFTVDDAYQIGRASCRERV